MDPRKGIGGNVTWRGELEHAVLMSCMTIFFLAGWKTQTAKATPKPIIIMACHHVGIEGIGVIRHGLFTDRATDNM